MRFTEPYTIYLRTLPSGKKVYYYQFRDERNRRSPSYSLATASSGEAKRRAAKLYREGKMTKHSEMTFRSFAEGFFDEGSDYILWHERAGRKLNESTLVCYRTKLDLHIMPYFGNMRLCDINNYHVRDWVFSLNLSAGTVNNAKMVFAIIMKEAKQRKLIDEVPSAPSKRSEKKVRKLLSVDELRQIFNGNWECEDERVLFLLLCTTGLRIGEALALSSEDLLKNYLHVRHTLHPQFGLGDTKTKKARYVPCPLKINPPFLYKNKQITEIRMCRRLHFICNELGIDYTGRGISLHSLRSFFNTYLRKQGISDAKIRGVMGHKDGTMTDWYTNWDETMFDEVLVEQRKLIEEITKDTLIQTFI